MLSCELRIYRNIEIKNKKIAALSLSNNTQLKYPVWLLNKAFYQNYAKKMS